MEMIKNSYLQQQPLADEVAVNTDEFEAIL